MPAHHPQLAAIKRPVKIHDLFCLEVGDLLSRRTVQRLQPEVFRILVTERIKHSLSIMSKADSPIGGDGALQVQYFRVLWRIDWDQCQLFLGDTGRRKSVKSGQLAIWRDIELVGGKLAESFRLAPVQRHSG